MSLAPPAKAEPKVQELLNKHQEKIVKAADALHKRTFHEQYPENPKAYPEDGDAKGRARFEAQLGKPFDRLMQPMDEHLTAKEVSPYTQKELGVAYPWFDTAEEYVKLSEAAFKKWRKTDVSTRAALLVEALDRHAEDFFELAYATMHTTGQGYMMSFQASGPHGNDRAMEAIALGYQELTRFPGSVHWEKNLGKTTAVMEKFFRVAPKGVALAIGCSTFPVWNTVPGVFASLITGNSVIVKPHPGAIYPAALFVSSIQQVLSEYGFDPHTILLAADLPDDPRTKALAEHPKVKIIDYTGGSSFGDYVEALPGKTVFTEKAGVNSIIFDSTDDLKGAAQNIAFSLSLYSGQMCTCPQNIFIPKDGITVAGEKVPYEKVTEALGEAIKGLTGHPKAGPAVCGAVQNDGTRHRAHEARKHSRKVLLESRELENPQFPEARTATPELLEVSSDDYSVYSEEFFGPVAFVVPTEGLSHSVELARDVAANKGAISCSAYCTDATSMDYIADEMADAATPVSFNLTGQVYVNQNMGFTDFHVSGGNPAGNATFTDPEFVVRRFNMIGVRVNKS